MKGILPALGLLMFAACCPQQSEPDVPLGASVPAYDRGEWGRWIDADKDCQDSREEVLIAESEEPVQYDARGCKVIAGKWTDLYTGEVITDPTVIDIDHVVAIQEAHNAGGWRWSKEEKLAYFNDLTLGDVLIAVGRSVNRSKGSRDIDEWMPPSEGAHCEYLRIRAAVFSKYSLDFDCAAYVQRMSTVCKAKESK